MRKLPAFLFVLAMLANGCVSQSSSGEIDESETKAVLDHHWQTFLANDLDGVMEDYVEESILITPNGTFRGLDEIRKNFGNAFRAFPSQEARLTLNQSLAVADVGYIVWEAETPEFVLSYGTDTFIIRNGKIIRQTFGGVRIAK